MRKKDSVQHISSVLLTVHDVFSLPATPEGFKMTALVRAITPVTLIQEVTSIATDKVSVPDACVASFPVSCALFLQLKISALTREDISSQRT